MAAALGVAMNDGFLIAVSRRARADPEAFMLGSTRLNESNDNANDAAVPRAGLAPFSGAAHRLSGTPQQQPEDAEAGRVAPSAKGMDGDAHKDAAPPQAEPMAPEACDLGNDALT